MIENDATSAMKLSAMNMASFSSFKAFNPSGTGPTVGFGNLRQPLNPLEAFGVWPSGEFRITPANSSTPEIAFYLGGLLALVLVAIVYGMWRPRDLSPMLSSTLKESTMLMFIIGMSLLFSYVMSYLHISQSAAQWIVGMQLSKWLLLAAILVLVIVLGFFLPPVSIILMTAPIILPPLKAAGFDLIWFGILMTIVMETELIHPPVGLNIFVIKNIAPDIPLGDVVWGIVPFVILMTIAVVVLCFLPEIALWLPDKVIT